MSEIKFSVSISVYNKDNPEYFSEALHSIYNQTLVPEEVVLVVDGPVSSKIKNIIHDYEVSKLLKVVWLKDNVGHGKARRIGLNNCSNEYVAIMDSDDICDKERFEKQVECFRDDKDLSIVGGSIIEFIEDVSRVIGKRTIPSNHSDIVRYMKSRCPFNQMTVMFKKSDVEISGGYLDWYHNEDYYLWLRMYQNSCKFYNLQDVLVYARAGKDFYNRRGGWKYFVSELKLQRYMYKNGIINFLFFLRNILVRFIVQIILTNNLRGFVFKKYFRER